MKRPSQSAALAFRLEGIAEFAEGATVPVSVQLLRDAAATLRAQAAAYAEREAECERLLDVDWSWMPTGTTDCLHWGKQDQGYGPCGKCAACWINQNIDELKELKRVSDKMRAVFSTQTTISTMGGTCGYAMNGPAEGELCEILPTGEYRVLSSGATKSILDAPECEVFFKAADAPTQEAQP